MKSRRGVIAEFSLLIAMVLGSCTADSGQSVQAEPAHLSALASAPPHYQRVAEWPRLPAEVEFGAMSGVDVDRAGHVMVIHRGSRDEVPEGGRIPEPVVVTLHSESGEVLQT